MTAKTISGVSEGSIPSDPTFDSLAITGTTIVTSSSSDFPTTLSVPAMDQATTITIPDPGAELCDIILSKVSGAAQTIGGSLTVGSLFSQNGIEALDSITAPNFHFKDPDNQAVFSSASLTPTKISVPTMASSSSVTMSDFTGTQTSAAFALSLGTSSIAPSFASVSFSGTSQSALSTYEEPSSTSVTWTGIGLTDPSGTLYYTRIGRIVHLTITGVQLTTKPGSSFATCSATLSSRFRPGTNVASAIAGWNNGSGTTVKVLVSTDGTITIGTIGLSSAFTVGSFFQNTTGGWEPFTISYPASVP